MHMQKKKYSMSLIFVILRMGSIFMLCQKKGTEEASLPTLKLEKKKKSSFETEMILTKHIKNPITIS
jgi:hypothetical protein